MDRSNNSTRAILLILISACILGSVPVQAFSLRDARELCKNHRFKIFTVVTAAVVYMYTHKLVEKTLHDYMHPEQSAQKDKNKQGQDSCEAYADAFIKSTKLIGTIFKVYRAITCPDEGKVPGDQYLDDLSQMA